MNLDLMVDGVRYALYSYKNEGELQKSVEYHIADIFGENSIYFAGKGLTSIAGVGSAPDGFVLDLNRKKFYLMEV